MRSNLPVSYPESLEQYGRRRAARLIRRRRARRLLVSLVFAVAFAVFSLAALGAAALVASWEGAAPVYRQIEAAPAPAGTLWFA